MKGELTIHPSRVEPESRPVTVSMFPIECTTYKEYDVRLDNLPIFALTLTHCTCGNSKSGEIYPMQLDLFRQVEHCHILTSPSGFVRGRTPVLSASSAISSQIGFTPANSS